MGPKLSKKRQKSFDESSSSSLEVESLEPQHVAKKAKGVTTAKSRKGKEKRGEDLDENWPEYFHSLFRVCLITFAFFDGSEFYSSCSKYDSSLVF